MAYPRFDRWLYFNTADSDNNSVAFRASDLYSITPAGATTTKLHFKNNALVIEDGDGVTTSKDYATVIVNHSNGQDTAEKVAKEIFAIASGSRPPVFAVIADDANGNYIEGVTGCGAITINLAS